MNVNGRRYLKFRELVVVQKIAQRLSRLQISPNQISITSIFFAALAAICFLLLPDTGSTGKWLLPILAAVFIQCRLLCNLFDGMVAIEGEKNKFRGAV